MIIDENNRKPYKNEFSWNKKSNLLFIDSPFEVGFSKYNKAIHHNDSSTAFTLYNGLKDFFEIFPWVSKK